MTNAQELFLSTGQFAGVFYCFECYRVKYEKHDAESCCTCRYCGEAIPRGTIGNGNFSTEHGKCGDNHRHQQKAERLAAAEVVEGWDGFVYCDGWGHEDGYFPSLDDFLDFLYSEGEGEGEGGSFEWPERVFCCKPMLPRRIDSSDVLEMAFGEQHEDVIESIIGLEELDRAIDKFYAVNKELHSWEPDYGRCVLVPCRKAGS